MQIKFNQLMFETIDELQKECCLTETESHAILIRIMEILKREGYINE